MRTGDIMKKFILISIISIGFSFTSINTWAGSHDHIQAPVDSEGRPLEDRYMALSNKVFNEIVVAFVEETKRLEASDQSYRNVKGCLIKVLAVRGAASSDSSCEVVAGSHD